MNFFTFHLKLNIKRINFFALNILKNALSHRICPLKEQSVALVGGPDVHQDHNPALDTIRIY